MNTRAKLEKDLWSSWIYEHITCLPLTSEWQQTKNLMLGIELENLNWVSIGINH